MNFKAHLLLALLLLLSPTLIAPELIFKNYMVVWNVGQGQWATLKDVDGCHHFDMGGERNPLQKVLRLCAGLPNFIYLSHWDWDHVSFVGKAAKRLSNVCLMLAPLGTSSSRKRRDIARVPKCLFADPLAPAELTRFSAGVPKNSNDRSHVLLARGEFLIPGDSTVSQEKQWSAGAPLPQTKWLLLGHHGSRTSTSEALLRRLPRLKVAVASARYRRYGHPHVEVIAELRLHHVPLLRTEDWGNLWFELAPR